MMEMLFWQITHESRAQGRNMGQKYEFESDRHIKAFKSLKLNEMLKEKGVDRKEKTDLQYLV